jgi:hypothetical protein
MGCRWLVAIYSGGKPVAPPQIVVVDSQIISRNDTFLRLLAPLLDKGAKANL